MKDMRATPPSADADAARVQAFFEEMETAMAKHPLFAGAAPAELDGATEALEKYLMTKLHDRTFGAVRSSGWVCVCFSVCNVCSLVLAKLGTRARILKHNRQPHHPQPPLPNKTKAAEDAERDALLAVRCDALQFVEPRHLEVRDGAVDAEALQQAARELNRMNSYKAPRDKLVCVLNCCRVIGNALHAGPAAANGGAGALRGWRGGGGGNKCRGQPLLWQDNTASFPSIAANRPNQINPCHPTESTTQPAPTTSRRC